jgi:hypothetical protein
MKFIIMQFSPRSDGTHTDLDNPVTLTSTFFFFFFFNTVHIHRNAQRSNLNLYTVSTSKPPICFVSNRMRQEKTQGSISTTDHVCQHTV